PTGYQLMPGKNCHLSVPKTSSLCIFRSLEPSVRTLTPLKWRSVLTVKPNVINRLLKTRSIMQERQGAEREVQCLLKIGILARDSQAGDNHKMAPNLLSNGIQFLAQKIARGDEDRRPDQAARVRIERKDRWLELCASGDEGRQVADARNEIADHQRPFAETFKPLMRAFNSLTGQMQVSAEPLNHEGSHRAPQ